MFLNKILRHIEIVKCYILSQSTRVRQTITWYQYSNIIKPGVFRIKLNIELIRSSLNTHFQSRIVFLPVWLCDYMCLSNILTSTMTWKRRYSWRWKYELSKTVVNVQKVMITLREIIKLKTRSCWKFDLMFVWGITLFGSLGKLCLQHHFLIKSYNSGHQTCSCKG